MGSKLQVPERAKKFVNALYWLKDQTQLALME